MSNEVKKGELVVKDSHNAGSLQVDTSVKFEGKITTSDLIESVIFQIEEELLDIRKELNSQDLKASKNIDSVYISQNKLLVEIAKKYKNKDVDKFITQYENFIDQKLKVSYRAHIAQENNVDKLIVRADFRNGHYTSFSKNIEVKMTDAIKKNIVACNEAQKVRDALFKKIEANAEKISELPRLKKRVKATFVKNMLSTNTNDKKLMFEQLRKELMKAKN